MRTWPYPPRTPSNWARVATRVATRQARAGGRSSPVGVHHSGDGPLVRDPNNSYDRNAIAVYDATGAHKPATSTKTGQLTSPSTWTAVNTSTRSRCVAPAAPHAAPRVNDPGRHPDDAGPPRQTRRSGSAVTSARPVPAAAQVRSDQTLANRPLNTGRVPGRVLACGFEHNRWIIGPD